MKKKQFCKNHPDRAAYRKCYYCKEPLCSDCQHHYEKHIFCGKKCYYSWKAEKLVKLIKPYRQLAWFILILLISDLFIILFLNRESIPQKEESLSSRVTQDTSVNKISFKSDELVQGNEIVFKVTVPENRLIALARNGQFIETVISRRPGQIEIKSNLDLGRNSFKLFTFSEGEKPELLDSISVNYFSRRVKFLEQPVYRVNTDKKFVALTFDGGSLDNGTINILDTLKKYDVKCTMFLTGDFIHHYPNLVKRIIADGHETGNHSYSHPHLTQLEINGSNETLDNVTYTLIKRQLNSADSIFNKVGGKHFAPLWRAPYGEFNNEIIRWAALAGYKHIGWSDKCDTWDWVADTTSNIYRKNVEILARLLMVEDKYGLNGKIILMHLGTERSSEIPYKILGEIIRKLRQRGYHFVTVSELINSK